MNIKLSKLSSGTSNLLHLIRWICALLVVFEHTKMYGNHFVQSTGSIASNKIFLYISSHAHSAVMVFFVLSGYLIAYTTIYKNQNSSSYSFSEYILDRWSRIYSVLFVAVFFTVIVDRIGIIFSPAYLNPELIPQRHKVIRFFINMFCLQGIQGYRVQLGSNPALWSIGYEFIYYVIFGIYFFRTKIFKRQYSSWLFIFVIILIMGWKMTLYFTIWLLGAGTFYLSWKKKVKFPRNLFFPIILILIIINHSLNVLNLFALPQICNDFLFALSICCLILTNIKGIEHKKIIDINRFMADFSYSTYAFHLPIIFFYYAVIFPRLNLKLSIEENSLLLVTFCLVAARILYHLTEKQRWRYKKISKKCVAYFSAFNRQKIKSIS